MYQRCILDMDLNNIEKYLRPTNVNTISNWNDDYAWLAGGTWLFSQPQPHLKTLVDMQSLGWSEIDTTEDYLVIGATCPLDKLLHYNWSSEWTAIEGLKHAIHSLAASFKVVNVATIGGNICLALSVGTIAPFMVAVDATYEIFNLRGESSEIPAAEFQIGSRQTILKNGEVLRRILIPLNNLQWQVSYQRFANTTTEAALAIVVSAYNRLGTILRVVVGGSIAAPIVREFYGITEFTKDDVEKALIESLETESFLDDNRGSADYRQEITGILIRDSLSSLNYEL